MSMPSEITVKCPKCGREFKTTMWRTLNADVSPKVAETLLNGELFILECPKCHEKTRIAYPMLYHDMSNKLLVSIAWRDEDLADAKAVLDEFKKHGMDREGYRFRLVKNDRELIEKAMIFKEGLDDRVIEIIKDIQRSGYPKQFGKPAPNEIYFLVNQENHEEWSLLYMDNPLKSQHISRDIYERGVKDFLPFCSNEYEENLWVNYDWVTEFLKSNPIFGNN